MLAHTGLGAPNLAAAPASEAGSSGEFPDTGYESQVGVWHVHERRRGRTGKRYRIYPGPPVWILDGGVWNDDGIWIDEEEWED